MINIDGITYCDIKTDKAERGMAWHEGRNLFIELLLTLCIVLGIIVSL